MTQKLTLRYLKKDRFNNSVFIASDKKEEQPQYEALMTLNEKITNKFPDAAGVPCYEGDSYITLRITKQSKSSFREKNTYHIQFKIKQTTSKDKRTFINAVLVSSKLHTRAEKEDSGDDVDFD